MPLPLIKEGALISAVSVRVVLVVVVVVLGFIVGVLGQVCVVA